MGDTDTMSSSDGKINTRNTDSLATPVDIPVCTSEVYCKYTSYARSTINIYNDFTEAFLKSNNTVGHVPMTENFQSLSYLQMSG